MTLQERLRQMGHFASSSRGCAAGERHLTWADESLEAANKLDELEAALRERDALMWAMVRASGGKLFVSERNLMLGVPPKYRIEQDVVTGGRTFVIESFVRDIGKPTA